jgi:4-aminobutyrate aminotransferase
VNAGDAAAVYYPVSERRMTHGRGVFLYDSDGNAFLDCASATFNLSLGYGHPAVLDAMKLQMDEVIHMTSGFQSPVINTLSRMLVDAAPAGIVSAHLKVAGGSEANEGAIKMAQRATGRRDVISLFRSHLGQTVMTAGLSGNGFRRENLQFPVANKVIVPDPHCYRCFYRSTPNACGMLCADRIADFAEYASSGSVAAVVIEPISGNGGNIVPPMDYLPRVRQVCDDLGIKLIFDEIQTGIGRTGHMFAAEYFGVAPDAITVAKGLGGSGAQVAAILASEPLGGLPINEHSFTYGGNLMAAAAGVATMTVINDEAFLRNVRETGAYIMNRLAELQLKVPAIGDVRGVGLMIGIELVDADGREDVALANRLAELAMEYGLILRTSRYGRGSVLKIRPPLILTMAEATLLCDRFDTLLLDHAR